MEFDSLTLLMDLFAFGCGVYAIYTWIRLLKERKLFKNALLLPKDKDPKDCRDEAGLVAYLIPRTGVLGVTLMLYGTFNLINEQMDEALLGYPWMFIPIGVLLVVIFWYAFALSGGYRKYFE